MGCGSPRFATVVGVAVALGLGGCGGSPVPTTQTTTPAASSSTSTGPNTLTTAISTSSSVSTPSFSEIGAVAQSGNGTFTYSVKLGPILYGYRHQMPPAEVLAACSSTGAGDPTTDAFIQGEVTYSYNGVTSITPTANASPLQGLGFNQTTVGGLAISQVNGSWACQSPTPGQMQPGEKDDVQFWLDLTNVSSNAQPGLTSTELQTFNLNLGTSLAGQAGGSTKATGPHAFDCDGTGMLYPFRTAAFTYTTDSGQVSCKPTP